MTIWDALALVFSKYKRLLHSSRDSYLEDRIRHYEEIEQARVAEIIESRKPKKKADVSRETTSAPMDLNADYRAFIKENGGSDRL